MLEAVNSDASTEMALRLVSHHGLKALRRRVALGLVVELEDMPVRVGEAVGRAMPDVAVGPADPQTGTLESLNAPLESARARSPEREVREPRRG